MLETPKGAEIEYDLFNRMVKYEKGTDVYTYTYNGDGQRMSKTVNGVTTYFVWDGMDMILEHVDYFNNTGYYYGPGGVEFQQYSDGMHLAAAYVKNALGDVVGTYDVMSGVTLYQEYCYDAYGNLVEEYDFTDTTPPSENPFRYRGEYYDTETGFYYLRNRYYDPKAGRFITEDPIRDGTNWYTYCAGNPVMFTDPVGLDDPEKDKGLSDAAKVYTKYYGDKWREANARYQAATTIEEQQAAQQEMKDYEAKADDIRQLDKDGKIKSQIYDVPLYNQGNYKLCWAFCWVMIEETGKEIKKTQAEAEARAIEVAKEKNGDNWNDGAFSNHLSVSISCADDLYLEMMNGKPLIAYYYNGLNHDNPNVNAHEIVVTGVVMAPGHETLVMSNNPWGEKNIQSYSEFSEIPGDTSTPRMKWTMTYTPF